MIQAGGYCSLILLLNCSVMIKTAPARMHTVPVRAIERPSMHFALFNLMTYLPLPFESVAVSVAQVLGRLGTSWISVFSICMCYIVFVFAIDATQKMSFDTRLFWCRISEKAASLPSHPHPAHIKQDTQNHLSHLNT